MKLWIIICVLGIILLFIIPIIRFFEKPKFKKDDNVDCILDMRNTYVIVKVRHTLFSGYKYDIISKDAYIIKVPEYYLTALNKNRINNEN